MNWYLITNILAGVGCLLFLVVALAIEKFTWRKISSKHIAIVALFVSLNVILTNLISYNLPVLNGVRVAMGDWILFLNGAIFGPLIGWIGAVCGDVLGTIVNVGGTYHAGFMFDKVMLSFMGSLVFVFKKNNLITLKIIFLYAFSLAIESLVLNPIWLYTSGWSSAVYVHIITNLIKYPIVLTIYTSLVIASLIALNPIVIRWQTTNDVWCLRKGLFWQFSKKGNKKDKINISNNEELNHG